MSPVALLVVTMETVGQTNQPSVKDLSLFSLLAGSLIGYSIGGAAVATNVGSMVKNHVWANCGQCDLTRILIFTYIEYYISENIVSHF